MTPAGLTAPFKKEDAGKAELFLTFLEKELKPYINSHYRAANNSILVGHSMGGLFVLNALLESPNAFDNFVSMSPSVWLNDHAIMAKAKATKRVAKNKKVINLDIKSLKIFALTSASLLRLVLSISSLYWGLNTVRLG